jgi:hypothetical protein
MTPLIAYCGLDCAACPAYQATQANDITALEKVVELWESEYHATGLTPQNVMCDGCTTNQRMVGHCSVCKIRSCGVAHGVSSCAACPEYACEELEGFFKMVPAARVNLESLRN